MADVTPSRPSRRPDSAAKVARLAQRGKGRKVRFQGGALFPTVMAAVVALGVGLIVYARESAPAAGAAPTANDHWHLAYGFYACASPEATLPQSGFLPNLIGNIEDDPKYQANYIHSHDDGVIHWHAYSGLATGTRARLGIFLDNYGVDVGSDGLVFPETQNSGTDYLVADRRCATDAGPVDAVVKVVVWDSYDDPDTKTTYFMDESLVDPADPTQRYIADFGDIRVTKDAMALTVAYVALDEDVPMPPSSPNLPELGAVDAGPAPTLPTGTTEPTGTNPATETTDPGAG